MTSILGGLSSTPSLGTRTTPTTGRVSKDRWWMGRTRWAAGRSPYSRTRSSSCGGPPWSELSGPVGRPPGDEGAGAGQIGGALIEDRRERIGERTPGRQFVRGRMQVVADVLHGHARLTQRLDDLELADVRLGVAAMSAAIALGGQ